MLDVQESLLSASVMHHMLPNNCADENVLDIIEALLVPGTNNQTGIFITNTKHSQNAQRFSTYFA